ncbi:putative palmitoyltransferase ZDHHC8 [Cricetulus griseus]|uniref:Putative palmitoyltransferase ZDHHC8 n=1 Tax=Cricetulus griseus TaxID=10029 RepID=A0A061I870_CRIGR|nr:putative palmitoyltransferase ZDHHC8 [Cricetulus griseus]
MSRTVGQEWVVVGEIGEERLEGTILENQILQRYVVESPRMPLSISLKPPFLRPELLERAVPLKVKLSDNGLKAGRSKSKGSLDQLDEKPLDLGPPLPPKIEAGTFGRDLKTPRPGSAESALESALSVQRTSPPTPAMYKFRPAFSTGPKTPFCGPSEQVKGHKEGVTCPGYFSDRKPKQGSLGWGCEEQRVPIGPWDALTRL